MGRTAVWRTVAIGVAAAVVAVFAAVTAPAAMASCAAPANEIEAENCLPGNPPSDWDISGDGDDNLQGFATDISVDRGQSVRFKVRTDASNYRLDIYRMGYYGGDGARLVAQVEPSAALPQSQPDCLFDSTTGMVDCGNWAESASWSVPSTAVSGIYFAALVREGCGDCGASHVPFVVRNDSGGSQVLFQTSDTTWQAYNRYGGASLYQGGTSAGRAFKVSYNRPFTTREYAAEDWVFNAEYPMVRWMERNGYDVSYSTGVDSDRLGSELLEHRAFLSVGHDEYWSGRQRTNVETARDAGVNLAFFSGNEVFWKTRWENNHRTLVTYKETHANAKIDPDANTWTGTWRDPRAFNPEGADPENALTGTIFKVNSGTTDIRVPATDGRMRLWRNTSVASLPQNQTATLGPDTLGYEWDEDAVNGARPAGLVRLSTTTASDIEVLLDFGSTFGSGDATHHLTLYRDDNGAGRDALVFGAGTVQWTWGLDANHDRDGGPADLRMQQATVNLLADMDAQPATLETGVPAIASTDTVAPTTTVTSSVQNGGQVTVSGTAADTGGGRVGAVEVSIDGGSTWRPAAGRENWTFTYTPTGSVDLRTRAADDSGNLGPPPAGGGGTPPGGGGTPPGGGGTPPGGGGTPPGGGGTPPGGGTTPGGSGGSTGGGSTGGGSTGGSGGSSGSADRTAPRIRLTPTRVRVSSTGTARLKVACPSGETRCTVRLRLLAGRKTIASGTLTVDGGKTRTAALRLSRSARRSLARKGTQSVTVAATARDAAGNSTSTRTTIRLLASARR